jgi:hypothetical protein
VAKAGFTISQGKRIADVVKRVEQDPRNTLGDRQVFPRRLWDNNGTSSTIISYNLSDLNTTSTGSAFETAGSITLSAGTWHCSGKIHIQADADMSGYLLAASFEASEPTGNNADLYFKGSIQHLYGFTTNMINVAFPSKIITLASDTTYYLYVSAPSGVSTETNLALIKLA